MTAVNQHGVALEYAADHLKSDREVVMTAVSQDGIALEYAADHLKSDREVVMTAVRQDGVSLEYAADHLKSDREVVMTAVSVMGYALRYAAKKFQADKEVAMTAVCQNGIALECVAEPLQADMEVRLVAARRRLSDAHSVVYDLSRLDLGSRLDAVRLLERASELVGAFYNDAKAPDTTTASDGSASALYAAVETMCCRYYNSEGVGGQNYKAAFSYEFCDGGRSLEQ